MPPLPSISIVTPSFNHAQFLPAAIRSVLQQNYPNLDYLVVDGASTDDTRNILQTFPDLRWISEPDQGQSDAINKGFARTTGDVFAWLNSDDTYATGALHAVARFFADHPHIDVVYGEADFIDHAGNFICPAANVEPFSRRRLLHYSDFIIQPAAFFRRSAFQAVGGLDPSLNWAMDYDLWLKLAQRHRFAYLPRTLACYRWLGSNKTGLGGHPRIAEVRDVATRHGARRLPAYFRLEAIRLHLADAADAWHHRRCSTALQSVATALGSLVSSPRAMLSLLHPATWRIIHTGRILRRHQAADK